MQSQRLDLEHNTRLDVKGLSKSYSKGVTVLNNVSFGLKPGIFGLLGPNGAGKSTLMNILATQLLPDKGEVLFQQQSVLKQPQVLRKQLGFLPQSFGVYPRISAWRLLNYLALLKGIQSKAARHDQMKRLLQLTNLYAHKDRPVATFSGGMRQRFGLAQALLGAPKLLIVDEPTSGLDPYERNHFHQLISELSRTTIVILSTHLVADIASLCSSIMVLDQGEPLFLGPPHQLMSRIQGKVWSTTCTTEQLTVVRKRFPVLSIRFLEGHQSVHVLCETQPEGFRPVTPDLEDAYFACLSEGGATCIR